MNSAIITAMPIQLLSHPHCKTVSSNYYSGLVAVTLRRSTAAPQHSTAAPQHCSTAAAVWLF
jgi:hypothetical protein